MTQQVILYSSTQVRNPSLIWITILNFLFNFLDYFFTTQGCQHCSQLFLVLPKNTTHFLINYLPLKMNQSSPLFEAATTAKITGISSNITCPFNNSTDLFTLEKGVLF